MNTTTVVGNVLTVVASVAAGCAAAISIASTAAVTEASPMLRQSAQTEVVRLEPVVVTISKQAFETVRNEERAATELARANAVAKTRRG